MFRKSYTVRWSDIDANRHMRSTAYVEYAIQTRYAYFEAGGFPPDAFNEHQVGAVAIAEHIHFYKEVNMLETIEVDFCLRRLAPNGAVFTFENNLYKADGSRAAVVIAEACWMDMKSRRITNPPEILDTLMKQLPLSESADEQN